MYASNSIPSKCLLRARTNDSQQFPVILEVTPNIRSDCLELVLHYAKYVLSTNHDQFAD